MITVTRGKQRNNNNNNPKRSLLEYFFLNVGVSAFEFVFRFVLQALRHYFIQHKQRDLVIVSG